eukprot:Rhum_TRINITY_DN14517_c10_g1::Rhum_TRINITY_DN14517_c10_g1_i1::g.95305::m.95305
MVALLRLARGCAFAAVARHTGQPTSLRRWLSSVDTSWKFETCMMFRSALGTSGPMWVDSEAAPLCRLSLAIFSALRRMASTSMPASFRPRSLSATVDTSLSSMSSMICCSIARSSWSDRSCSMPANSLSGVFVFFSCCIFSRSLQSPLPDFFFDAGDALFDGNDGPGLRLPPDAAGECACACACCACGLASACCCFTPGAAAGAAVAVAVAAAAAAVCRRRVRRRRRVARVADDLRRKHVSLHVVVADARLAAATVAFTACALARQAEQVRQRARLRDAVQGGVRPAQLAEERGPLCARGLVGKRGGGGVDGGGGGGRGGGGSGGGGDGRRGARGGGKASGHHHLRRGERRRRRLRLRDRDRRGLLLSRRRRELLLLLLQPVLRKADERQPPRLPAGALCVRGAQGLERGRGGVVRREDDAQAREVPLGLLARPLARRAACEAGAACETDEGAAAHLDGGRDRQPEGGLAVQAAIVAAEAARLAEHHRRAPRHRPPLRGGQRLLHAGACGHFVAPLTLVSLCVCGGGGGGG